MPSLRLNAPLRAAALAALLAPALVAAPAAAQHAPHADPTMDTGGPVPYASAAIDVGHYALDLVVNPATRTIGGAATVRARIVHPTDELVLQLDTVLRVTEVVVDGTRRPFTHRRGDLRVPLARTYQPGEALAARVVYGGAPRVAARAPWDGGFTWGRTPSGAPWIATTVQGEGADLWFPAKDFPSDEPDSVDLAVTVPAPLVVAANGRLRGVDEVAGPNGAAGWRRYRWHVAHAINNYGLTLGIAPYAVIDTTYASTAGDAVPVQFFVLPERLAAGRERLRQFLDHVRWFEETLGPYPWHRDKIGVVHTPHLGMEHQSAIAYGSTFSDDADGFDWLFHHEFAHEYFGNLLTASDWRDFWIHEGFGTYMQVLYAEKLGGPEAARRRLARNATFSNVLPVAPRAVHSNDQIYQLPNGQSNLDIYYKGAAVLHALRFVMGEDAFFRALRRFVYPDPARARSAHPQRFVTTDEFVQIASAEAGRDLTWFFDVYVRQPALPRLDVTEAGGQTRLRWAVPGGLPFPMPVEATVNGRTARYDVPPEGLALPAARAAVRLDPNRWLVRAH